MTCRSPSGICDQYTCVVDNRCAWPTDQEKIWSGDFGSEYMRRSPGSVEANVEFFKRALIKCNAPVSGTVVEFGAGVGNNLQAIKKLVPGAELTAVEINQAAADALAAKQIADVYCASIFDWHQTKEFDLAFTKGVLIHIPAADLTRAYAALYNASRKYILMAEYYSPRRTEIEYRGRPGLLWKDDFAGAMLEIYPDLRLLDYGFYYHREPLPQDDLNWFLMEKR